MERHTRLRIGRSFLLPINSKAIFLTDGAGLLDPSRTAVPFWGQVSHIPGSYPPKRDCGPDKDILTLSVLRSIHAQCP